MMVFDTSYRKKCQLIQKTVASDCIEILQYGMYNSGQLIIITEMMTESTDFIDEN
jgi:hypothetical protein